METVNLLIEIHGGLGDQICAEPVIRFIKNKWQHYNVSIITHYPELFRHLNVMAYDHGIKCDENTLVACTHPKNDHIISKIIDFQQIHTIDFISLVLLKMVLDPIDKQIQIDIPKEVDAKIKNLLQNTSHAVVIHPGLSWQSKTFPSDFWQDYIDILINNGFKVIVVGKNYWANDNDFRGIVKDLDTYRCINLIDQLSILELCSVLKQCPVLISNDSGLIHLSGAFDNHVGIISTIRRPDTLFHWRNGIKGYKYYSLEDYPVYKDLTPDTIFGHYTYNANISDELLYKALPQPEKILDWVLECLS